MFHPCASRRDTLWPNKLLVFLRKTSWTVTICVKFSHRFFPRLWILSHTLAAEPAAILVNITSLAYADKYFPNSQIIFARRFLDSNHLHRLLELPEGTPVLVANKPRRIAEDLVENLQQLGINHLNYIPYWPGCDIDTTPYDTVVYAGFRSYCPENKKVYINLGYRNITPSTLAEIVKIYNLPPDFLNQFHIPVMQQLVSELYHRQDIHTQNQLLKS